MGIEFNRLKFSTAGQYIQADAKTEEGKVKKEVKPEEQPKKPETTEVGTDLLTKNPEAMMKEMLMKDLGFVKERTSKELTKQTELPKFVNSKGQKTEVDITDNATIGRLEEGFATTKKGALDDIFGVPRETYTVTGIDNDKLNRYLAKGLDESITAGIADFENKFALLG